MVCSRRQTPVKHGKKFRKILLSLIQPLNYYATTWGHIVDSLEVMDLKEEVKRIFFVVP